LPRILARMFVLENLDEIEDFARAYAQRIGESTMKTLCDEFKGLLEGVEWGCLWRR